MAVIDDKVVAMSFEGSKFESGVRTTLSSLDKLKMALKFDGASKGLNELSNSSRRVDFSHMASSLDDIKNRLGALRLTAIAAFSQIAVSAIRSGAQFAKAFTLDPIKAGYAEYSTNLNAVQTILANTAAQGTKLKDVNAALNELNRYSDKTIYNFSQMAKNIGTFTAAGVDLKTSTQAIKGIANLAALSGSSADQASVAMYQLSQALAAGRVSLQDWNSVVNAGMGGAIFQKALAQTAQSMGILKDNSIKLVGPMKTLKINGESFRESIGGPGPKWLTSDVLTKTLKQFTGDMTAAQLKAEGFSDAQIKSIQLTAKNAMQAATQVKTLSQMLDVAKETAQSGWAQTWQIIFGNFGEAKVLFTNLSNAVNGWINTSANARNKVLGDWKALGGRTVLINSIKTAFQNLGEILKPIKEAFRDIFPAKTGKDLVKLTYEFKHFAEALKPSPETVENIRRTFRGLFAVLDIGRQIVSGIFTVFGQLFHAVGGGNGSFLTFTATIGDFFVNLDKALKKGDAFHNFFVGLGNVLSIPLELIQQLAHAIANMFSGFSPGGFSGEMSSLTKVSTPFKNVIQSIAESLRGLGPAIGNALSNINWETVTAVIRTGLFGAFVLMMKKFIGGTTLPQLFGIMGKNIGKNFGAGILGNVSKAFGGLTGTMKAMQTELKARTLKEIAIAIALLAASVLALSLVKPERLNASLSAMTIMFGELLGAMAIMDKITSTKSFYKLPIVAASLILMAGAIDLLTISVVAMSRLSWEELSKGLVGVGALLATLSGASMVLSKNAAGMVRSSVSIIAIAVAIKILASAMADFGNMDWTQIAKGLIGVGGGLVAIAASMQMMPKGMVLRSASIVIIAAALEIIADAVGQFGALNLSTLAKGIGAIGASLVIIAGAMRLMPKSMVLTAAGLLLVAASLGKIESAVQKMGGMSIKEIGKGLVGLAGALVILAAALILMKGTVLGAAALGVAATGLALLVPAIVLMGRQSWGTLLKGLIGLAAAIGVIAGAALLLSPSIPALLGFGAALVVIGAGLALAGAGIALIGAGLSAIAVSGTASIGILVGALKSFAETIPEFAKNLVLGLLEIVKALAATAPQFVSSMIVILNSLLTAIIASSPKIGQAFEALLLVALKVLRDNQGKVIQAGFNLILALLQGLKNNIGAVVTQAVDVIVKFLNALSNNLGRIITAGAQILISLLKGIANNLSRITASALSILTQFLAAIASNIGKVITAGMNIVINFLNGIANKISDVINAGTNLIVNLITGIANAGRRIVNAATNAIITFFNALVAASVKLVDAGFKAVINFLNGIATAIRTNAPALRQAGINIALAIIDGMTFGLASKAKSVADKAVDVAKGAVGAVGKFLHINSPSLVFAELGVSMVEGLIYGMASAAPALFTGAETLAREVLAKFEAIFKEDSPTSLKSLGEFVVGDFAYALTSSPEDIISAFTTLSDSLDTAMKTSRAKIQEELNIWYNMKNPTPEAVKRIQKLVQDNQALLAGATAAHTLLTNTLKGEGEQLLVVIQNYNSVTEKLDKAKEVLLDAMKVRDDALKSFTDKYSQTPATLNDDGQKQIADFKASIKSAQDELNKLLLEETPDAEAVAAAKLRVAEETAKLDEFLKDKVLDASGERVDLVATYLKSLQTQSDAVAAYSATLEQLRALGLDDATYQKLLEEGTADQAFATQLLAGGKTAVDGLNKLDKQLMDVSKTLATNAAKNLYQAGVDAAQGLVDGLQSQKDELRKTMEAIAADMIKALKKALKQHSPSQEFASVGRFSMEGLVKGLVDSTKMVTDAVENAAVESLNTLRNSMRNISDIITDEINPNPVITPILDLSKLKAQQQKLVGLTDMNSYVKAAAISTEQTAAQEAAAAVTQQPSITFEQNNYSPEALSEIEIYRQTKNQLSQLRNAFAF